LKPKEHWENITHKTIDGSLQSKPSVRLEYQTREIKNDGTIFIGEGGLLCSGEIVTSNIIYNAGVFDKKGIVVHW
jgi:hypothetical protein